ncbi:hypothetical protein CpE9_0619 [Corynebacterium pseudotuberculosis]|nr:hypothetical protein CpPA05_03975 [Corynebacterium pseudotuberculosis]QBG76843.1 Hypothetical protein CpCAP1R_0612 [Corynebacterium pseudotuberculosis]QCG72126.1 Hypothetical protein CpOVI1FL_0613 [Corynebacterium pseudotuberculosis]QDL46827.1 Hypothetical protein CpOVIOS02_0613 [Corynebacterium pseudotuberculosis]QDL48932.1 hypothetical protein CpOVICCA32_0617 [Corynebacterium pseudotuberculosis]
MCASISKLCDCFCSAFCVLSGAVLLAANKKKKFVAIKALFCAVVLRSAAGVKLNRCLHHLLYLGTFLRGLHSERCEWLWM